MAPPSFAKPSKSLTISPLWSEPKPTIASWPPAGARGHYDVEDGDSWTSVGLKHGYLDPWDMIIFNLRTDQPREVNWYLYWLMGCTASSDGRNLGFAGAERRRLFVPPFAWVPDRAYTRGSWGYRLDSTIVRDLDEIVPHLKRMSWRKWTVAPKDFRELRRLIQEGKLTVKEKPLVGASGKYLPDEDTLQLAAYEPHRAAHKMTLVHELTHAVFDLRRYRASERDEEMLCRAMAGLYIFAVRRGALLDLKWAELRDSWGKAPLVMAGLFAGYVIDTFYSTESHIDLADHLDQDFKNPWTDEWDNPYRLLRAEINKAYDAPDERRKTRGDGIG